MRRAVCADSFILVTISTASRGVRILGLTYDSCTNFAVGDPLHQP